MAPIVPLDASVGVYTSATKTFALAISSVAAVGDTALAFVSLSDVGNSVASVPAGWTQILAVTGSWRRMLIYRKELDGTEGASASFVITNAPVNPNTLAAIAFYRGARLGGGQSDGSYRTGSADVTISANFPCPSLTIDTYSDLYVGACCGVAAANATPPAGATERLDTGNGFYLFDFRKEAAGASGAQTAVYSASESTGIAVAIVIPSMPPAAIAGVTFNPPGAIGLPEEGI